MFKENEEGKTHYENDNCGEPAHNPLPSKEEKSKCCKGDFYNDKIFCQLCGEDREAHRICYSSPAQDTREELKKKFKREFSGIWDATFDGDGMMNEVEFNEMIDFIFFKLDQAVSTALASYKGELMERIDKQRKRTVSREHYPQITENKIHDREVYNSAIDDIINLLTTSSK